MCRYVIFVNFFSLPLTLSLYILSLYTEMRELVPPIMNEKATSVVARLGDPVVVPCVAYANPKPVYR